MKQIAQLPATILRFLSVQTWPCIVYVKLGFPPFPGTFFTCNFKLQKLHFMSFVYPSSNLVRSFWSFLHSGWDFTIQNSFWNTLSSSAKVDTTLPPTLGSKVFIELLICYSFSALQNWWWPFFHHHSSLCAPFMIHFICSSVSMCSLICLQSFWGWRRTLSVLISASPQAQQQQQSLVGCKWLDDLVPVRLLSPRRKETA